MLKNITAPKNIPKGENANVWQLQTIIKVSREQPGD